MHKDFTREILMFKFANVSRALPRLWLSALLVLACVGAALAQTSDRLLPGKINRRWRVISWI